MWWLIPAALAATLQVGDQVVELGAAELPVVPLDPLPATLTQRRCWMVLVIDDGRITRKQHTPRRYPMSVKLCPDALRAAMAESLARWELAALPEPAGAGPAELGIVFEVQDSAGEVRAFLQRELVERSTNVGRSRRRDKVEEDVEPGARLTAGALPPGVHLEQGVRTLAYGRPRFPEEAKALNAESDCDVIFLVGAAGQLTGLYPLNCPEPFWGAFLEASGGWEFTAREVDGVPQPGEYVLHLVFKLN